MKSIFRNDRFYRTQDLYKHVNLKNLAKIEEIGQVKLTLKLKSGLQKKKTNIKLCLNAEIHNHNSRNNRNMCRKQYQSTAGNYNE